MKKSLPQITRAAAAVGLATLATSHHAWADLTKADNTIALNLAGSYFENTAPLATDQIIFNSTLTTPANAAALTLGGNLSVLGLTVTSPGGPVNITGTSGQTLTLGTGGIDLSAATQNLTLTTLQTVFSGNQTINVASGRTLAFSRNGANAGTGTVTLAGTGTIRAGFEGSGNTTSLLGTGALIIGSNITFTNGPGNGQDISLGNSAYQIDSNFSIGNLTNSKSLTIGTGAVTLTGTRTITVGTSSNPRLNLNTAIGESGGPAGLTLTMVTNSVTNLASTANTFSGPLSATNGTVQVSLLDAGGSNSSVGKSSNAASNILLTNSTINLVGLSAQTTDRLFTITGTTAATSGTISNSSTLATNTLTFSNTGNVVYAGTADQTRTVGLGGTNTGENVFNPTIANNGSGAVSLTKSGTGKWIVNGTNSYNGTTTLQRGTLALGNNSALGTSTLTITNTTASDTTRVQSSDATARTIANAFGTFAGTNAIYAFGATTGGTGNLTFTNTTGAQIGNASRTFQIDNATTQFDFGLLNTGVNSAIVKTGSGTLILNGTNTYAGNTSVSAGTLALADNAQLAFAIGSTSGTNNSITGAGTVTLEGDFNINTALPETAALTSGSWLLENVASLGGAYGANFQVLSGVTPWSVTGDVWTKTVGAQIYSFDETTGTLTLTVGSGGSSTFNGWASNNGVTGGINGDSDNDGIPNGVEYGLNTNPAASDGAPGTYVGTLLSFDKRVLTSGNADLSYRIEVSTDLGVSDSWDEVGSYVTNTGSTLSANVPTGPAKNFARLRVVVTP